MLLDIKCPECGEIQEVIVKSKGGIERICESCGAQLTSEHALEVYSTTFQTRGSGWFNSGGY